MAHVNFAGRRVRLPNHPVVRVVLGCALIIGGVLGFLPILGFWMIPLGLVVLSVDLPFARRLKRRTAIGLGRWLKPRWPALARMLGFSVAARGN